MRVNASREKSERALRGGERSEGECQGGEERGVGENVRGGEARGVGGNVSVERPEE